MQVNKKDNNPTERQSTSRPGIFKIAVGGGSGSGKTTLVNKLNSHFGSELNIISLDSFFKDKDLLPKYFSEHKQAHFPDYNHPASLKLPEILSFVGTLKQGIYVLEGHFALYYPELRELMDYKVFIETGLSAQLFRRKKRNLAASYGGSAEEIDYYNRECVAPAYKNYLAPSRQYADLIIDNNSNPDPGFAALLSVIKEAASNQYLHSK